jgi:cobalt-zinc-cadmium efflux system outer membrane protein
MAGALLLTALAVIGGPAAVAADGTKDTGPGAYASITLEQAVALALKNRPEPKTKLHQAAALKAKSVAAKKLPDPMISGGFSVPFTDPLAFPEASVMVSQSFPLSNELGQTSTMFKKKAEAVEAMAGAEALDIVYDVKTSYIAVAVLQEQIRVLGEIEGLAAVVVASTGARIAAGKGDASMAARAQVEVEKVKSERESLEASLPGRKALFAAAAGIDPASIEQAAFELPPMPSTDEGIDAAIAKALKSSPEIEAAGAEIAASEAEKKAAKAGYLPMMTVGAGYAYKSDNLMGLMGKDAFMITIGITVPIWFKKTKAMVDEAGENAAAMTSMKNEVEVKIKQQVAMAYAELMKVEAEHRGLVESVIPQIRLAHELTLASYAAGSGDLSDVIDSLQELAEARMKKATLEGEGALALAAYELALGVPFQGGTSGQNSATTAQGGDHG